ncbi:MAG: hypothetical protein L6Q99_12940 [Planctomycetes bacterium]|nr:hypothetical protein [Planctomycetota bacterium]
MRRGLVVACAWTLVCFAAAPARAVATTSTAWTTPRTAPRSTIGATSVEDAAQAAGASATWLAGAKSVEVGEPIELVLTVDHPLDATVRLTSESFGLDDSWVVLEPGELRTRVTGADRARTTLTARVASLEPGSRDLAPLAVELVRSGGRSAVGGRDASIQLVATPPHVDVRSVLGDADHERPPKGFRPPSVLPDELEAWPWLVGVAVLAALGLGVFVGRRLARRERAALPPPSALAKLDELEKSDLERAEAAREAHFRLTQLVRGEIDRRAGVERAALDDDEWLERSLADAGFAEKLGPERERLGALFAACREVKYGGALATHWAARERIGGARTILKRLEQPEAPR